MKALLAVAIIAALTTGTAAAIEPVAAQDLLTVPVIASAPAMDGTLGDPLWQKAVTASLGYDVNLHQPAKQPTTAYMLTDGSFLYVAFDVKTTAPISAREHTNGVGMDTDDEVQVDLWPGGDQGFMYKFTSTPIGTHYQFSTENNSYEPNWISSGKVNAGGFTVTMKIPLAGMRGAGKMWRVQFIRLSPATRESLVWRGAASQSDFNDVTFAGRLTGIPTVGSSHPKSRIAVYGLGSLASRSIGGSTSRAGVDLSIPIDSSTSFVATLHPDYSNVETDQQSISPTAFRRFFNEVRPFFTQGANFYNPFSCTGCPGIQELYTPAIPTPRDGYAIEGKEGRFNFAGFDAVGIDRNDNAQSFYYKTPNRRVQIATQRVAVSMPGFNDVTVTDGITYDNHSDLFAYYNWGYDRGTSVLDNNDNKRSDFGIAYDPPNLFADFSIRKLGTYYNPFDGIVSHPGIAGYNFNVWKQWNYTGNSAFKWIQVFGSIDRYHGTTGALNQTDNNLGFDVLTRNFIELWANTGSSYLLLGNGVFAPITINSRGFGWRSSTAYPTFIEYDSGRFGPGRIVSWARSSVMRVGNRASITLQANDTQQYLDNGPTYTQWLERLSYAYQSGLNESFAVGVRRIIGFSPVLAAGDVPSFSSGWNLSFAYHKLLAHNEIYLVYGDASAFSTSPQLIFKVVHYFGADKGT
jgi:hypothetical protein